MTLGVPVRCGRLRHTAVRFLWICAALASSSADADSLLGFIIERPDQSTTPVRFSVGAVQYVVPRNYLVRMSNWSGGVQGSASLRVTFPGFQPFGKETEACFARDFHARPPGCTLISFDIEPANVRSNYRFKNAIAGARGPSPAPFGFEVYQLGPDNARIDIYRKTDATGREIIFDCVGVAVDATTPRHGWCTAFAYTSGGGLVHFTFPPDRLGDAESMERGLLALADSFAPNGSK
jgi:hypothetical protein